MHETPTEALQPSSPAAGFQTNDSFGLRVGACAGFLAVALGAFGAHGLEHRASAEQLEWWTTGAHYHLTHALLMVVIGALPATRLRRRASLFTLAGIVLFSGSLYAMALGAPRGLGAVTPFGGLALLVGWVLLALSARRA